MYVAPTLIAVAVLVLMGVLSAALNHQIKTDRLPRPSSMLTGFGIRIPSTLRSDDAWRSAHVAIRPLAVVMSVISLVGAVGALIALAVTTSLGAFVVAMVAAGLVILLSVVVTVRADLVARRGVRADAVTS